MDGVLSLDKSALQARMRALMRHYDNWEIAYMLAEAEAALRAIVEGVERSDNPSDQGLSGHSNEMECARAILARAEQKG